MKISFSPPNKPILGGPIKVVVVLFLTVVSFLLAACGGSNSSNSSNLGVLSGERLATKVPTETLPPTVAPSHDTQWFVDAITSAPALTITLGDAPEVRVAVDENTRAQIVSSIQGNTVPTVQSDEWLGTYLPYPNYQLEIERSLFGKSTTDVLILYFTSPNMLSIAVPDTEATKGAYGYYLQMSHSYYLQESAATWSVLQKAVTPPVYGPDAVRYLLGSTELTIHFDGQDYSILGRSAIIGAARALAASEFYNSTISTTMPGATPSAKLYFTVEGTVQEVGVSDFGFTYRGHDFPDPTILLGIRHIVGTEGIPTQ